MYFDVKKFYEALDQVRRHRRLSWRAVALQNNISASTFTRMSQGYSLTVDTVAALLDWAQFDFERFVSKETPAPRPESLAIPTWLRKGHET